MVRSFDGQFGTECRTQSCQSVSLKKLALVPHEFRRHLGTETLVPHSIFFQFHASSMHTEKECSFEPKLAPTSAALSATLAVQTNVPIITLMTFRLIVPSSCVFVKYLQDFCLFFLRNARVVDVFCCVPLSVVVPDVTSPFDIIWEGQKVCPLRRQMECWRDFRLLGRSGEKSIFLLFSVRCQH